MVGPAVERFTATKGKEFGMVCRSSPHFLALYEATLNDRVEEVGPFRNYVRTRTRVLPPERPVEAILRIPLDGTLEGRSGNQTVEPRVHGAVKWAAGPNDGQAAHFAVGDDPPGPFGGANLCVPDHAAYSCPDETLLEWGAAALWVRHDKDMSEPGDPYTRPLLYVRGQRSKRDSLLLCFIYNELRVRLYDSNGWLCGAAETPLADLKTGDWHHYAVAWQPNGLQLYVNGQLRATDEEAVLPDGTQAELYLGWCDGNWFAAVDQVDLWLARGVVLEDDVRSVMQEVVS